MVMRLDTEHLEFEVDAYANGTVWFAAEHVRGLVGNYITAAEAVELAGILIAQAGISRRKMGGA